MFDVLISLKEIENWVVKVLLKLFLNGTKYISELEQFKKLYSEVCFEWKPLDALSFKKHIFAHLISYQKKICQTLNLALQADFVVHFVAYLSLNCTTFMSAECTENCVAWNCSPSKWAEWKKNYLNICGSIWLSRNKLFGTAQWLIICQSLWDLLFLSLSINATHCSLRMR